VCRKYGVSLNPDDIRRLGKPRDQAWLRDAYEAGVANDQFVPKYVDMDEFARDVEGAETVAPLRHVADEIQHLLSCTELLCDSEAYAAGLVIYKCVKAAADENVPGAAVLADRLGKIFAVSPRKVIVQPDEGTPPTPPAAA